MTSIIEWRSIIIAVAAIAGLPMMWNILARSEYYNNTISKFMFGSKLYGAYLLALIIFTFSLLRDAAFAKAIAANPSTRVFPIIPRSFIINNNNYSKNILMNNNNQASKVLTSSSCSSIISKQGFYILKFLKLIGAGFVLCGTTLVTSSFIKLGITGTYLGDYFNIKLPKRITSFPFNYFNNPMYIGATMNFIGAALAQNSGVGLLLAAWVGVVYYISSEYFENPFTDMIYGNNNNNNNNNSNDNNGSESEEDIKEGNV